VSRRIEKLFCAKKAARPNEEEGFYTEVTETRRTQRRRKSAGLKPGLYIGDKRAV
jgi:hypothetical protein